MVRRRLQRLRRRAASPPPEPAPAPARRGLGEPPAGGADDAELDALRGELVRELDRVAADSGGSSGFRRN
jgi:hypothetical protein